MFDLTNEIFIFNLNVINVDEQQLKLLKYFFLNNRLNILSILFFIRI
jgi:hypothetical protein